MAKWISIKRIGIGGYKGAVIYKLSFDEGRLFYIGSTVNASTKPSKWVHTFRRGRQNKRIKELVQDKSKATFEIIERVDDISKLFEREEYHIQKHFDSPFILNRSRYGSGAMDEDESARKPVNQYLNDELIATYPSLSAAVNKSNGTLSQIWKSCYGIRKKTVNGFRYSFNDKNDIALVDERRKKYVKEVVPKFTDEQKKNIVELYSYVGIKSLAKQFDVGCTAIRNVLIEANMQINSGDQAKRIVQLKNEVVVKEFPSIGVARRELGASQKRISAILHGRAKSWHGFTFKFVEA